DHALTLFNGQNLVHTCGGDPVNDSARPSNFYQIYLCPFLKTKVQSQITLREVAAATPHFVDLGQITGNNLDPGSDAVAIAFHTDGFDQHAVVSIASVVMQKLWRAIQIAYDHVDAAVVIQVAEGYAARDPLFHQRGAELGGNFRKRAVPVVSVEELALAIMAYLRIDMTISDEKIYPAVVVIVEKLGPPANVETHRSYFSRVRDVGERVMPVIPIQGIVLVGEVRLEQVQLSVVIEVGNSDAHAALLAAIPVDGSARNEAYLFEGTVSIIVVQEGRRRVIRNIDIDE